MLCLLKTINPKSLNRCFANWGQSMLPEEGVKGTLLKSSKQKPLSSFLSLAF